MRDLLDRRQFLSLSLFGSLGATLPKLESNLLNYDDTLRDHCWMWGHDSGYYDGTGPGSVYNIPLSEPITMPDACAYMGIPNVCAVTWDVPSPAYLKPFLKMKRVSWVTCGHIDAKHPIEARYYRLVEQNVALLKKLPNLVGFDLDDYFHYSEPPEVFRPDANRTIEVCSSGIGHANLLSLRKRLSALERTIDLRLVLYIDRMKNDALVKPALDQVDTVMAWTWTGENIGRLRENFARCRAIAPNKSILMGIYMWDFGAKKPLERGFMVSQLDIAHELYMKHLVDGFIFHCTPLVNKKPALEAVELARAWIARHANDTRD